jgi:hypothetical protein
LFYKVCGKIYVSILCHFYNTYVVIYRMDMSI